jgi:hypothetical protein
LKKWRRNSRAIKFIKLKCHVQILVLVIKRLSLPCKTRAFSTKKKPSACQQSPPGRCPRLLAPGRYRVDLSIWTLHTNGVIGYVLFRGWLLSHSIMFSRVIISSHGLWLSMTEHCIIWTYHRHLGCLHFLAIVNKCTKFLCITMNQVG